MADRYTYLPQIGIVLAITWTAADAAAGTRQLQRFMAFSAVAVTVVLALCAFHQTGYWRNSESIWLHTLAVTANNDVAHNNVGEVRLSNGHVDDAIREFRTALDIRPEFSSLAIIWAWLFKRRFRGRDPGIPECSVPRSAKPKMPS